jgi:hypothetical protein
MKTFFDLVALTTLVCFVIDLSGFTQSWKGWVSAFFGGRQLKSLRPFDCSLCMSWWAMVVYLIATGEVAITTLCVAGLIAYGSQLITTALQLLTEGVKVVFTLIQNFYDKL